MITLHHRYCCYLIDYSFIISSLGRDLLKLINSTSNSLSFYIKRSLPSSGFRMGSCAKQLAQSTLVNENFDRVAQIPFVKNKWITVEAWLNLIKKEVPNCAITDINSRWFKLYLFNSGRVIQSGVSPSGYYSRSRKMKLGEVTAQKKFHTCILVTDPGTIPPVSPGVDWAESIITAVILTHKYICSGLHSSYTQTVLSAYSVKRKQLSSRPQSGSLIDNSSLPVVPSSLPQLTTQHANKVTAWLIQFTTQLVQFTIQLTIQHFAHLTSSTCTVSTFTSYQSQSKQLEFY